MLDTAITDFFEERKATWKKSKIKETMSATEKTELMAECESKFALSNWLPDAANRANQLALSSHPAKFTHPSARATPVITKAKRTPDGYLRSGNVDAKLDVFGNAAALDVFKFLSIQLVDGKTIIEHLEAQTETIQRQFELPHVSFTSLRRGFLAIKKPEQVPQTSGFLKQVYFPVSDGYHLLSLLTPSGLVFDLKQRINDIRFSDQAKEARAARRNREPHDIGFDDLFNLTAIGYGGTQPQNMSLLNSQSGGRALLLPSLPPELQQRTIRLPTKDFFGQTVRPQLFREPLLAFHRILITQRNNLEIREKRDQIIEEYVDQIIAVVWQVRRSEAAGWSSRENYDALPAYQKLWLDDAFAEERAKQSEWIKTLTEKAARWFLKSYEQVVGEKQRVLLGPAELSHVRSIIERNAEHLR